MNYKEFIKEICNREGKKSQVKIGDVKEVVAIIKMLIKENPSIIKLLLK